MSSSRFLREAKLNKVIPAIWKNTIRSCGANGILVQGNKCHPDIRGNIISGSRKAGIKLTHSAGAHIGGNEQTDIELLPFVGDMEPNTVDKKAKSTS
jgi:hypothetical protein